MLEDNTSIGQMLRPTEVPSRDGQVARRRSGSAAVRNLHAIRLSLLAGEALTPIVALLATQAVIAGRAPIPHAVLLAIGVAPVIWLALFQTFGLHRLDRLGAWGGFRSVLGATSAAVIVLFTVGAWWGLALTRPSIAWTFAFALAIVLLVRGLVWLLMERSRTEGRLSVRTLVVGANGEARGLLRHLASGGGRFLPVGYVGLWPDDPPPEGVPYVGNPDGLEELIRAYGAECVFVVASTIAPGQILSISQACRRANAELRVTANVSDIHTSRLSLQSIDGVTSFVVKPTRLTSLQSVLKRCFDVVLGSLCLLLAIPFIVVIALTIRLTSRGPAFFRQARVTKDGRVFTMYKFRTMVNDPERALEGAVIDLTHPFFKLKNDPRLTPVGRFLRSFSLDELPQLWNVIRGDMSLVGPRPLPVEQVEANEEFLRPRHEVLGGLTGLWQISGRSDLDSGEALQIDRFYIENWSLGLDLHIIGRTIRAVLTRRGAR